jgi:hypothetical protein
MAGTMGNALQHDILELILNAVAIANLSDDAASSPATNLYVSLHTASPTNAGDQTSNEISYTGYSRVAVSRNSGSPAWTISGSSPASASPNAAITFGNSTGGTGGTVTHAAIGTGASGTGKLLWYGAVSPTITVATGLTPILTVDSVITQD